METLASTIIAGAATVLAALVTALPALTHRSRKIQRQQAAQIDSLETWVYAARRATRRYNSHLPGGVNPVDLPDLPDWMTNAADE